MSERKIQNQIRNALAGRGLFFRANVGQAWTGDEVIKLDGGSVLITNARPFSTGLPAGFSDVFGLAPVVVDPCMVGTTIGVFAAMEIKQPGGRVSDKQAAFLAAINRNGGRAGVARSTLDALKIIRGDL